MVACGALGSTLSALNITPVKPIRNLAQGLKIAFLSVIFCLTIVFANMSLNYIPVSFNQAIGATTPFFTAIFAFLLQSASGRRPVAAVTALRCRSMKRNRLLLFWRCMIPHRYCTLMAAICWHNGNFA